MRAYVREQACLPERLTLRDIADMYFYNGPFAVLYRIAQRHTRVTVSACVEHNSVALEGLYLIDQIAFMVRLKIRKERLRPFLLDI